MVWKVFGGGFQGAHGGSQACGICDWLGTKAGSGQGYLYAIPDRSEVEYLDANITGMI